MLSNNLNDVEVITLVKEINKRKLKFCIYPKFLEDVNWCWDKLNVPSNMYEFGTVQDIDGNEMVAVTIGKRTEFKKGKWSHTNVFYLDYFRRCNETLKEYDNLDSEIIIQFPRSIEKFVHLLETSYTDYFMKKLDCTENNNSNQINNTLDDKIVYWDFNENAFEYVKYSVKNNIINALC